MRILRPAVVGLQECCTVKSQLDGSMCLVVSKGKTLAEIGRRSADIDAKLYGLPGLPAPELAAVSLAALYVPAVQVLRRLPYMTTSARH